MLPAAQAAERVASKMQEFSISAMAVVGMHVNGMGDVFKMRAKNKGIWESLGNMGAIVQP